ncbi:hypothetical protein [Sandarakinorhabdus sp.]|jgi:hypothetical protein|uniref:hypothetical protein n=1 Tax=Sandarakinorhabdus sp. TaxID=1916663 RepID=UPI0028AFB29E|nr:hypothetical protein [Sandarakinorhabdus sp.]
MAAPSLCAHLPEKGSVAAAAPLESVAAKPRADRSLICPPGFVLETSARIPVCTRPGQAQVEGDPRAACRASLALGPVAPVPTQWRPTRSCPGGAITAVVRLEGTNLGLADVDLTSESASVKAESVGEEDKGLKPAERPSAQGCFAHQCRLVRLSIAADAPDEVQLRFSIKDGASSTARIPVITHCPDPLGKR